MANFTKQAIKASFLKLLDERPLSKITVRDIVEECGINRNSFYYHFQDIPTLLTEIITDQTNELIASYPTINSLDECFFAAFQVARQNRRAVLHIYNSVNRDLFVQSTLTICEHVVRTYIDTVFPSQELGEENRRVLVRFLRCQLFGMCVDWISSGMKDDAFDELRRAVELIRGMPEHIVVRSRELPRESV